MDSPAPAPVAEPLCPEEVASLDVASQSVPPDTPCRTLLALLQDSPSLSEWLGLLQARCC